MPACQICYESFTAQRSTARYCSNRCRVATHPRREHLRDEDERMARGGRWCENCFEVVIEWWERPDKRFCSNGMPAGQLPID